MDIDTVIDRTLRPLLRRTVWVLELKFLERLQYSTRRTLSAVFGGAHLLVVALFIIEARELAWLVVTDTACRGLGRAVRPSRSCLHALGGIRLSLRLPAKEGTPAFSRGIGHQHDGGRGDIDGVVPSARIRVNP